MLAAARRAPRAHIEARAPWQPPHAALLRPRRHELKLAARTRGTCRRLRVGFAHGLVACERVTTEAARFAGHARAVGATLLRAPHNVDATGEGPLGTATLCLHHSLAPGRDTVARRGL